MPTKICPNCGSVLVFKAGGISKKTNKPYSARWECGNCAYVEWVNDNPSPRPATIPPQSTATSPSNVATPPRAVAAPPRLVTPTQNEAEQDKKENINWLNALNNAVELVAHHPSYANLKGDGLLAEIAALRDLFYNTNIAGPKNNF